MPPSVNWSTQRITIPQSDLTLVSGVLYELDVDEFRLDLKDIEDGEEGIAFPDTHRHNTQVTLSGVTYARTFEVINGYTVEFEDTGSPYTVRCIGANHNLADVFVAGTTEVSLIIGNSAGLITVSSGSGLSTAQDEALTLIKNLIEADEVHTATQVKKLLKGTATELLVKDHSGTPLTSFQAVEP
jgi:hypothetical protein